MRRPPFFLATLLLVLSANTCSAATPPTGSAALPAGEAEAKAALDHSPRHGEYVDVKLTDGTPIRTWVVYPERKGKAGVVVVIHEIYGLSDWIRSLSDQLAAEGFIAVAPDLISGLGPGGGGTDSVATRDDVVNLVRTLTPEMTAALVAAVRDYAVALPAANGRYATIGFCWGGGRSFEAAAATPAPRATVVYYGTSPDSATLARISAPVLGNYGGDDERVDATIEPAKKALAARKKFYEPNLYAGAGHGFLRQQDGREGANLEATRKAWPRTITFLKKYLEEGKAAK